jgi:hypothetical protein
VHIAPTEVGIDQQRRLEEGRSTRGLGEAAALETLERVLSADTAAQALLLFEDSDIMRRRVIVDERVDLISTGDFSNRLIVFLIWPPRPLSQRAQLWGGNGV